MSELEFESTPGIVPKPPARSGFRFWLFELDRILRGDATRPDDIKQADIKIPVLGIAVVVIVLGVVYGFCMGVFSLVHGVESGAVQRAFAQTFASMCKVPLLFLLTLVVTFPSLYVFNALVGSQLRMLPVLKLLIASLAVNLSVLASLGPILVFFSVSTPSYSFIVLLNVAVFTVAGGLGLIFLIQTLNRLTIVERQRNVPPVEIVPAVAVADSAPESRGPTDHIRRVQIPAMSGRGDDPGPLDHPDGVVMGGPCSQGVCVLDYFVWFGWSPDGMGIAAVHWLSGAAISMVPGAGFKFL